MSKAQQSPETVSVHIPLRLVKRGGRKEMRLPDGASSPKKMDETLVKALARAFRWKRMLESGEFTTIAELAKREEIANSYMTRILRLTLLAPDIVEAALDGKHQLDVTLAQLLAPFPLVWNEQQHRFKPINLSRVATDEAPRKNTRASSSRRAIAPKPKIVAKSKREGTADGKY